MHLHVSDVHCTEVDCIVMDRKLVYNLLICWWCWWSYVAGVERNPCWPGCQCVHLHSAFTDSGSRLNAADWHRLMIAYRLQQKYIALVVCCIRSLFIDCIAYCIVLFYSSIQLLLQVC